MAAKKARAVKAKKAVKKAPAKKATAAKSSAAKPIKSALNKSALVAHPLVAEAAVVGFPCEVLGERVHAYLYAPNAQADADAVRAHCAARLADYKVPEKVMFVDKPLPRNANGKLLKRALRG